MFSQPSIVLPGVFAQRKESSWLRGGMGPWQDQPLLGAVDVLLGELCVLPAPLWRCHSTAGCVRAARALGFAPPKSSL